MGVERPCRPGPGLRRLIVELRDPAGRRRHGRCFVEGPGPVRHAVDAGVAVERLIVSWRLLTEPGARQAARRLRRSGVPCDLVSPEAFRELSSQRRASGIAAVVRPRWTRLDRVDPRAGGTWLVISRVRSPGNLGTLVRSLSAFGGGGLVLLGDATDPFDPAVVRASMGSVFDVDVCRTDAEAVRAWREALGIEILGATADAEQRFDTLDWPPGALIFVGDERQGLSASERSLCDRLVRIPIRAEVDSLNVAVAGSLLLYRAYAARSS